jgi:hypothetical protein
LREGASAAVSRDTDAVGRHCPEYTRCTSAWIVLPGSPASRCLPPPIRQGLIPNPALGIIAVGAATLPPVRRPRAGPMDGRDSDELERSERHDP